MKSMLRVFFLFSIFAAGNAFADGVALNSMESVHKLFLSHPSNFAILDANSDKTREKMGSIKGAIKLTSPSSYSASELPAEKNSMLVFYCYNKMCTASHDAAKRATSLGYTDVSVLPDGILGWKEAGYPIEGGSNAPLAVN